MVPAEAIGDQASFSTQSDALPAPERNDTTYIAMNRFRIEKGQEAASEKVCPDRDSHSAL